MAYRVHDILEHWRAQKAITAEQYAAGRRFLKLYDATIRGSSWVIDPEKLRGARGEPAAERIAVARGELNALRQVVGETDFGLLCRVLGRGEDLNDGTREESERKYLARRLRDALAVIARGASIAPLAV